MNEQQKLHYQKFLTAPLSSPDKSNLEESAERLAQEGAFDGLSAFGTGGMREIYGLGSNRLNVYTIARLNMAFAEIFLQNFQKGATVVIGYDSRLSNPVLTKLSFHLLSHYGIEVKIFSRPTPTPLVSFAVLTLQAQAGIILTASHNPPAYNGYKVYWQSGAQIIPPIDKNIQAKFDSIEFSTIPSQIHDWLEQEIPQKNFIYDDVLNTYIERLKKEAFVSSSPKDLKILYSPFHGCGGYSTQKVFQSLNFTNFKTLSSQFEPDGNFPTLKSPNPEEPQAFALLLEEAQKNHADILIAQDPDADRLGSAYYNRQTKQFDFFTGNQIGCLLLESIASMKAKTLKKPFMCKTIVTSELQRRIADSYSVTTMETLTGFKYIAEELEKDPQNYLFGGEESYGYLPVDWVRDKDSISSAIALCELAQKINLSEALDEIFIKHGLYEEQLHNIKFSPQQKDKQEALLQKLKDPAQLLKDSIGKRKVIDILDLQAGTSYQPQTDYVGQLKKSMPPALVVQYHLHPEGRLTIRPSGTEPKVKIYVSLMSSEKPTQENLTEKKKQLQQEAKEIIEAFLKIIE